MTMIDICAEGVEFAHQNDVVHGTIDQADIVLTEKGTVKLQNLTVSPMRNQKNDEPEAKPIADFKALAKLGKKLLDANPGSDSGPGTDLVKIFASMNADGAKAISELRQWVEATSPADEKAVQITKSGANPIFSRALSSSSKVDKNNLEKVTYQPDAPDAGEAAVSSASIVAAAKASTPFLIACALGLVMFGGIITYGISRVYSKMVAEPAVQVADDAQRDDAETKKAERYKEKERQQFEAWQAKQEKNGAEEDDPSKASAKEKTPREKYKKGGGRSPEDSKAPVKVDASKSNPDATKSDEDESKSDDRTAPKSEQPEAKKKASKYLDLFGDKKKVKAAEADKEKFAQRGVPAMAAGADSDDLTKLTNIGVKTQKALYAGGVKTYKQITEMTPAALDQVLDSEGFNRLGEKKWQRAIADAKPLAEAAAELAKEHFRKVPDVFVLPPINSTEPKVLTRLQIPGNYFLSTELVSPAGVAQRRVFFELKEDSSEDEKWIALSKRNKRSPQGVEIATFHKTDDRFIFAWTPEAANDKSAIYLRNCLIRLSTPDGRSRVSKLRKPNNKIRSLRISKDSLIDEMNVVIGALPHPDKIQIKLRALNNKERTIEVVRPLVTFDSPAIVKLKRGEKGGFMNMQVWAKRSGKTIKLTAALTFRGVPIKSHKQLETFKKQLGAINANAQQIARGAKKGSPEQKQASVAKANAKLMEDYQKSIDWLLEGGGGIGEAINFEVVADFEDGLVVLAKSNKNVPKTTKKKKK